MRPTDAPDLNLNSGTAKKGTKRERPARQLVYITLLPTHDMTLESYPRIAIDVPRDIVSVYRENEFGLALYNAGAKDTTFRLAVAELDTSTPPPTPTPNPSAPPPPSAIPVSATPTPEPHAVAPSGRDARARLAAAVGRHPGPGFVGRGRTGAIAHAAAAAHHLCGDRRHAEALREPSGRVRALCTAVATPAPSPRASGSGAPAATATSEGSAPPAASGSPGSRGFPRTKRLAEHERPCACRNVTPPALP